MTARICILFLACVCSGLGCASVTPSARPTAIVPEDSFTVELDTLPGWREAHDSQFNKAGLTLTLVNVNTNARIEVLALPVDESAVSACGQLMTVLSAQGGSVYDLSSRGHRASFSWSNGSDTNPLSGRVVVFRPSYWPEMLVQVVGLWPSDQDAVTRGDFDWIAKSTFVLEAR